MKIINHDPIKELRRIRRRKLWNGFFELKWEKSLSNYTIWQERERYKEFWESWLVSDEKALKNDYKFEDLSKDDIREYALKRLENIGKEFHRNKEFAKRMKDIKDLRKGGVGTLDTVNQILISETKEDIIMENGKEVSRTENKVITAKKIERIEFSSEMTIRSIENILASQEMSDEWFNDYKKAIDSANNKTHYEGKYQFFHLQLAAKFKKIALDLADKFEEVILNGSIDEVREAQTKMSAAMKLSDMMEKIKEVEMAPIKIMSIMHEGGMFRQTEMQRAICNDRQMIEMGNIIVTKEQKEVFSSTEEMQKLKEFGLNNITNIFIETAKNLGAVKEVKEPIDAEYE